MAQVLSIFAEILETTYRRPCAKICYAPNRLPNMMLRGITRMNTSTQSQTFSWQNYRRRRFWFFVIWVTYVPGVFVLGYPLSRLFDSGVPIYILAGAWMVAFIRSANYMELFPCPKCHRAFFRTFW